MSTNSEEGFEELLQKYVRRQLESQLRLSDSRNDSDIAEIQNVGLQVAQDLTRKISDVASKVIQDYQEREETRQKHKDFLKEYMDLLFTQFFVSVRNVRFQYSHSDQLILNQHLEVERSRTADDFMGFIQILELGSDDFRQEQERLFNKKLSSIMNGDVQGGTSHTRQDTGGGRSSGNGNFPLLSPGNMDTGSAVPESEGVRDGVRSNSSSSREDDDGGAGLEFNPEFQSRRERNDHHVTPDEATGNANGNPNSNDAVTGGSNSGSDDLSWFACIDCPQGFQSRCKWIDHNVNEHNLTPEDIANSETEDGNQILAGRENANSQSQTVEVMVIDLTSTNEDMNDNGADIMLDANDDGASIEDVLPVTPEHSLEREENRRSQGILRINRLRVARELFPRPRPSTSRDVQNCENNESDCNTSHSRKRTRRTNSRGYKGRPSRSRETPLDSDHVMTQEILNTPGTGYRKIRHCNYCDEDVVTKNGKKFHFFCKYNNQSLCERCGRRFSSRTRFSSHQQTHSD